MHIFMLADSMDIGGAETHVYELSRLLVLHGHRVTVLSSGGATARRLSAVGVEHIFLADCLSPDVACALARIIRREKPHAVHAHTRRRAFLCRLLLTEMTFPVVFTAHALFDPQFPQNRLSYFPPDTIAVSHDIAEHLVRRFHVPKETVTVIANGVNTDRPAPPRRKNGVFTILTVSRQDRDSVRAATLLCAISPRLEAALARPVNVTIVGGGNAIPTLRSLAQRANSTCGRTAVRLLGNVADPTPLYDTCDVFVGVSRAAMEAMSAARPVILCGDQGYLGILDRHTLPRAARTNLCARGESPATERRLLHDLVSVAAMESEARAALGAFSRQTVTRLYSAEQMVQTTERVYARAIERFRRSRQSDAVVCGYYGYGNCGDELILRHLLRAQAAPPHPLRLAVMTADGTAPTGTVGIPRYHVSTVGKHLRKSSALILGGGSLLQDATSRRSLYYYLSLILMAHRMGLPVMLYANGIGPLSPASMALCRRVLKTVDVISLRDRDSYRAVRAMQLPHTRVVLGADPVLGEVDPRSESPRRLRRIALFPHGNRSYSEQMWLADSVARLAISLRLDVAVAPMNPAEDGTAARRICARISTDLSAHPHLHATVASGDPDAILRLIERSELVIGERLHALILAFRAGVPSVGLGNDPKIGAFLREIDREPCFLRSLSPHALLIAAKIAIKQPPDPTLMENFATRAHRDAVLARKLILRE